MKMLLLPMLLPWSFPLAFAAEPPAHFAAQSFLAGHCWKGTFPDGKRSDEHCFEWLYDGRFLRDRHKVTGEAAPYGGETTYYWDAASRRVHYIYINVLGGHSRGTVDVRDGALFFPEEKYSDGKLDRIYRSQWRRDGDDAYLVLTEMKVGDEWKEAWRIVMRRQP